MNTPQLGVKKIVNRSLKIYLNNRFKKLQYSIDNPHFSQNDWLENLIFFGSDTRFGHEHHFHEIDGYQKFRSLIPLQNYESLQPYISSMMEGKSDVLWPGAVNWYSKSSGTTGQKSKYIPVSKQNLKLCHVKGTWDTLAIHYNYKPDAKIFEYKNLIIGGTLHKWPTNPQVTIGDVSAILIHHMPMIGKPFYSPDFETAFMREWDEKLEKIAQIASREEDIGSIGGVPTWNIVLFKRILEITGKQNLLEVWPKLQVYFHGGVNFQPYRKQFQEYIPDSEFSYHEVYNASEGYFASQNDPKSNDMLLFVDNGIFYEFIPLEEMDSTHPTAIPIWEVEKDKQYAMVITTNSGLWRYQIGDTIMFTSTNPYKIVITGRTKHFINAFGEEVIVSNTDSAIATACQQSDAIVSDYSVAPKYIDTNHKGHHQWLIEFEHAPSDINRFASILDEELKKINSDYEAKRYKDMALERLQIVEIPHGTFQNWLEKHNRLGAQAKIPRLCNHRKYIDEIISMLNQET